jgi:hypothetical protein
MHILSTLIPASPSRLPGRPMGRDDARMDEPSLAIDEPPPDHAIVGR